MITYTLEHGAEAEIIKVVVPELQGKFKRVTQPEELMAGKRILLQRVSLNPPGTPVLMSYFVVCKRLSSGEVLSRHSEELRVHLEDETHVPPRFFFGDQGSLHESEICICWMEE